jgi:uroporphyrinogen-III decarboxylase
VLRRRPSNEKLHRLINRTREIFEEATTPEWGDLWDRESVDTHNFSMFAHPNPIAGTGLAPFVFFPDPIFYAKLFEYNLEQVFKDAYTHICFTLEQAIWNYENLHHDASVGKTVLITQIGFFAPSLFGMMPIYSADAVPWIKNPIIKEKIDFAKLDKPDFYTSGLSPLVHRMYGEAKEILPDDFNVEFTTWLTGPFSLLFHLRGINNLALDMMDDPPFVHEMMAFATECMKEWWTQRARFLGRENLEPIIMGDDEVGIPWISPALYEEFVLPYESDLSEYFGRIDYWHSCGNCTKLLPILARIPKLRMMDVGPWTALQPAVELFGKRPGSSIMKRLHPVSEVLMATEEQMRSRLLQIKATCYDVPYMLLFDGLNILGDVQSSVEKVLLLDLVCHQVFHEDPTRPEVEPEMAPDINI